MDLNDLDIDDRIEIYTPSIGTYWGYITSINTDDDTVTVDDIGPAGRDHPTTVPAAAIVKRAHRGRRPEGHVGVWRGRPS